MTITFIACYDSGMTNTATATRRQVLTLSTEHLPATIAANLATTAGVTGTATPIGFLMEVPTNPLAEAAAGTPDVVTAILAMARLVGCDLVTIAPDGPRHMWLPIWDGDEVADTDES